MTKAIVKKITKKPFSALRSGEDVARSRRFRELAEQHGARDLESTIDKAIKKSDERRERVRRPGSVTVTVS